MTQVNNPLMQYYRSEKCHIKLPSGTNYYKNDEVSFNDSGEISIKPMTGQDEITMKNPDALLNGTAITDVIKSCVEGVKKPELLLSNDIDAIMVAIRVATYGDTMDIQSKCPACGHSNDFEVNLSNILASTEYLDEHYPVNLDNGLTVFVKPFTYKDTLKSLKVQFEQTKIMKALENDNITDEKRLQLFSESFSSLTALNSMLVANSIVNIVDESNDINVNDKEFIKDFLKNTDKKSFDKIEEMSRLVNHVGITRELSAKCQECKHEWESPIDFNPVNFFTGS
jgi:hypothetical protein